MIATLRIAVALLLVAGPGFLGAWWRDSVRIAPEKVEEGKTAWVVAKASPQTKVHFQIDAGTLCGKIDPADAQTNDQGEAKAVFTPTDPPASCEATVRAVIARDKDARLSDPGNRSFTRTITVVPAAPLAADTIDATTAITIILIASFAIDRLVTLAMLLPPLARLYGEQDEELAERRKRLTYIVMAGSLGLLLGYFGDIRLLAGLGFSTNVALNAIVTALILTAGSDAISALLKKIGDSSPGESESKPLIVQGELSLKRLDRKPMATESNGHDVAVEE